VDNGAPDNGVLEALISRAGDNPKISTLRMLFCRNFTTASICLESLFTAGRAVFAAGSGASGFSIYVSGIL
jgi:hypothetical protein